MSVRRSIAASLVGRYLGLIVGIGSSIAVARLMPPSEVGLFGVAFAAIAVASGLRHFGTVDYLIQLRELGRDDMGRAFSITMGVALVLAALIWGLRWPIANFYGEPRLAFLLALLSVNVLLSPFGIAAMAVLQRDYAFGTLQATQLVAAIGGAAVAVALAALGFGATSLAWGQIATTVLHVGALALVRPAAVFCGPELRGLGRILSFGTFRTMSVVIGSVSDHAVPLIVGRSLGFTAVGLYDRASGIETRLTVDLAGAAARVLFVALAEAKRDLAKLPGFVMLSAGNLTAIMWPALTVLAILAEPIIVLLYGEPWREAAPIFRVLALGGLAWIFGSVPYELMTAEGRAFTQMTIEWFGAALKIGLLVSLVRHGLVAAACAHAIALTVIGLLFWALTLRRLRVGVGALAATLARSAVISLAAGAGPLALVAMDAFARLGAWPGLIIAALLSIAGWALAAFLLRHPVWDEAKLWLGSARQLLRASAT